MRAGSRIGQYEIEGQIGSGGMGDVFRDRHARSRMEKDPRIGIGIPHWSPRSNRIVYIKSLIGAEIEE